MTWFIYEGRISFNPMGKTMKYEPSTPFYITEWRATTAAVFQSTDLSQNGLSYLAKSHQHFPLEKPIPIEQKLTVAARLHAIDAQP